jgi:hypothetical protein
MEDAAIDMCFRGEVDYGIHAPSEDFPDQAFIAYISLNEFVAGILFEAGQVFKIARIGKFVEVQNTTFPIVLQHVTDKVGSDESGAACD